MNELSKYEVILPVAVYPLNFSLAEPEGADQMYHRDSVLWSGRAVPDGATLANLVYTVGKTYPANRVWQERDVDGHLIEKDGYCVAGDTLEVRKRRAITLSMRAVDYISLSRTA